MAHAIDNVSTADSSVLCLASRFQSDTSAVCSELLTPEEDVQSNILAVTVSRPANQWLAAWDRASETTPANGAIIDVTSQPSDDMTAGTFSIETVDVPPDLTAIAIRLFEYIDAWPAGSSYQTSICFHSLTPLLQYKSTQRVSKFVHKLTDEIDDRDASIHYHMDPAAHKSATIETYASMVDAVVEDNGT